MKQYTTFEEIDRDLKYLKLKSKIDLEEVKLGFTHTKESFSDSFSPINFVASTAGSIIKKAFILKMVEKIVGIATVKKKDIKEK